MTESNPGASPLTRANPRRVRRGVARRGRIPAHAGEPPRAPRPTTRSGAHPRSRGRTSSHPWCDCSGVGASPLTRANRRAHDRRRDRPGRIPAHAGEPSARRTGRSSSRAHPRSRGRTYSRCASAMRARGASPLTRANRVARPRAAQHDGRIPAHAGEPPSRRWTARRGRAHPRSRGRTPVSRSCAAHTSGAHPRSRGRTELPSLIAARDRGASPLTRANPKYVRQDSAHGGASPLTRANQPRGARSRSSSGRIPAHAGEPDRCRASTSPARAHPRSRGRTASRAGRVASWGGASPLTRANLGYGVPLHGRPGRIPAHAGEPAIRRRGSPSTGAHPRSRGRTEIDCRGTVGRRGASPLTRANRGLCSGRVGGYGRIPAHAGEPRGRATCSRRRRAHPRSRGRTQLEDLRALIAKGASPLTRANPHGTPPTRPLPGRIPAHAGEPSAARRG